MRLVSTGASVSGAAEGRRREAGWGVAERTGFFLHWTCFRPSLAGLGRVASSPDWGLGRVMWSWGLGCIRTKGSSTETSLGRERGTMKR